jgi:hypothetical protein
MAMKWDGLLRRVPTSIDLENNVLDVPSPTQDVFVMALDPDIGQSLWIKELDTSLQEGDNRADQIVALNINPLGNVDAMISSMNIVKGLNDMFLLDMNKDTGANTGTVDVRPCQDCQISMMNIDFICLYIIV